MEFSPRPSLARHHHWVILTAALIAGGCGAGVSSEGSGETEAPWVIGSTGDEVDAAVAPRPEPVEEDTSPGCTPSCELGQCGDDGCGGDCGSCSILTPFCFAGWCQEDPPPKHATLELSTTLVDFGLVPLGEAAHQIVSLTNISKAEVVVTHVGIAGDGAFVFVQGDHEWRSTSGAEITVQLLEPWTLAPGEVRGLEVGYAPVAEVPGEATLRLTSNDAEAPEGHMITLRGGPPVGCASWAPSGLDFGATMFGTVSTRTATLTNCGTLDLQIADVAVTGDNAGAFALQGSPPEALAAGDSWEATVRYAPTTGSVAALGALEAQVSFEGGEQVAALGLEGFVVLESCPVAQITIAEPSPVTPGTILHLSGVDSFATEGPISGWSWSVTQPDGGVANFFPNAEVNAPTFAAALSGTYTFSLTVLDAQGEPSCAPATATVQVVPEGAVYVEMVWDTPGDPDPSDQGIAVGADLDLHLAHPDAAGPDLDGDGEPEPWFDPLWDCYWFNPDPDWGPFTPPTDDDPHLVVEDVDGAGPEVILFDIPETDTTYRVGVHVFNDHGYGPSTVTVRVYVLGLLQFTSNPIPLEDGALWEVAEIAWLGWPDAVVTPIAGLDGGPVVFSDAGP